MKTGWICPKCEGCYAPFVMECSTCPKSTKHLKGGFEKPEANGNDWRGTWTSEWLHWSGPKVSDPAVCEVCGEKVLPSGIEHQCFKKLSISPSDKKLAESVQPKDRLNCLIQLLSSGIYAPYRCIYCDLDLSGYVEWTAHRESKDHKLKIGAK